MTTEDSTPELPLPEPTQPDVAADPGEPGDPALPVSFFDRARDFLLGHPEVPSVPAETAPAPSPEPDSEEPQVRRP